MEPKKTNAPLARGVSGNAGKYTAMEIVANTPQKRKLNAAIEQLRLPEYETYLVHAAIDYIKSMRLNRWRSAHDAIEHALGLLDRLGFMSGRAL
jgi:hypothetical protein